MDQRIEHKPFRGVWEESCSEFLVHEEGSGVGVLPEASDPFAQGGRGFLADILGKSLVEVSLNQAIAHLAISRVPKSCKRIHA